MLEKTQSFLLNLFPCEDGVLPFDRELLFESCAAWMADRLFALGPVTVLSPGGVRPVGDGDHRQL